MVFGLSKSGQSATKFLLENKSIVYVYDETVSERTEQVLQGLEKLGAKRIEKEDIPRMAEICDGLVLSPGIPIDHPIAVAFKRNRKAVVGETELAARIMRCPILAVTGTNGKTTVVTMLTEVLNKGGVHASACGNIGTPMIEYARLAETEVAVAEISSFQLETLQSLRPHIAIVLNVTEDHLNRHYNMENYLFLKRKLLKNSTETEYAILNYDDPMVRGFAEKTKARTLYFSVKERVAGAYYENGDLYFGKEKILAVSDLPVGGLHNVQNALAVIVAAKIMGVSNADIASALTEFKGIKHRVETIGEVNGVTFIDDSKGTNVDATLKAVEMMQKETVLLLGGKNKGYDYGKLFEILPKTKIIHAVVYGENRFALLKSAREYNYESVTLCDKFDFAVRIAALKAKSGQAVLLSPASASFDEFANYEERGEKFAEIVQSFLPATTEDDYAEEMEDETE
jgi:UDP-N-acetylmuramoylalanine--D-glutamate ligase